MEFLKAMKSPPPEFSPAAFWFWYGDLDSERMRKQIDMMVEQGVYNGFMHARAYLKTPYLGEEWWKTISACIDESEKVGFFPWLYDEYAWPSGTAGSTFNYGYQEHSKTLSKGYCNEAKFLSIANYPSLTEFEKAIAEESQYRKLETAFYKDGEEWLTIDEKKNVKGEVIAFYRGSSPRFVDYLNPQTIREFMDYTHEEYKKRFGEHFGKRVPGIFFDEIFMINKMPWTDRFADEFKKRKNYDLIPKLYALAVEGKEEERKIRNDYYTVVSELYEETFFKQIGDWCNENNLDLTGHIEEFFFHHPGRQGQFFNNMRHLAIPGADCHDYRYRFPRKITYREPKFSVSTARAYGKKRMMSEALGGAGWGCSLQQFKRGVNTLGAMGINMITLHGFYSECGSQGEQADWPNSFFFQNPYWRHFKHFADYINRICYMNTQGTPVVDVGLYYPIDEMQMETIAGAPSSSAWALDKAWNGAMDALIEQQIDVDMIDEPSILNAKILDGRINVGVQKFRVLLCPDVMCPSNDLKKKLDEFVACGGKIIYYACGDTKAEGVLKTDELADAVRAFMQPDAEVLHGAKDNLYVNHREIEGKEVYFVANSAPRYRSMILRLREKGGIKKLSPENGELSEVSCRITENGTEVELCLGPDEAFWLVVDKEQTAKFVQEPIVAEELAVAGKWEFMPISSEVTGAKQLTEKSTILNIPLAVFSSELHPAGKQIRIQNTPDEKGRCGRHLSLWKANWITRRLDWVDISQKTELYCRKKIMLDEKPAETKICIAAVNEWSMWVNGRFVAESSEARIPSTVDIGEFLNQGENLIAIKVINKTPMEHFNLLSVDNLLPHEMISLIAQAEITVGEKKLTICTDEEWEVNDKLYEGWEQPTYSSRFRMAHSTQVIMFGGEDECWTQGWNRGTPPLLPWGDFPLFGETISYPQRVCYSITLPAGSKRIFYPEITGDDISVTIDGMKISWENGVCALKPDGLTHQLQIAVMVNGENEGLHKAVEVEVEPFRSALCDWRLHGLKWHAGFARYRNNLCIEKKTGRYTLKLGQVVFYAEVWVNGVLAGARVWEPYQLDVTDLIKNGNNEFVVIVANSAAVERQFMLVDEGMALGWDRYWNDDNIQREGENLVSGLMGPIQLIRSVEA